MSERESNTGQLGIHRKYCKRYNLPNNIHELTFSCYKHRDFLIAERVCECLADTIINACKKQHCSIIAYVFMPDHVHIIVKPELKNYSISGFLKSVKNTSSKKEMKYLRENDPRYLERMKTGEKNTPYRFWQAGGGYDRNISDESTLLKAINYIHNNPVRKGLVRSVLNWKWSSTRDWLLNETGLIFINKQGIVFPHA